jgi:hypothetical protein
MRDLEQDPRSVAGAGITALRSSMGQVLEDLEPLLNNLM